jgi:aminoglycoside phosphotransferase (APT) family kinase protein
MSLSDMAGPETAAPETAPFAEVQDAAILCRSLAPLAASQGWEAPRKVRLRMLSAHSGSRCTLAMRIETASQAHELIGKVYADDRPDVAWAMDQLWRAGFHDGAEFSIPRALGYIASLRLLVMEKVEGTLAQDAFLAGDENQQRLAAGRCAGWLARFHRSAPKSGRLFSVEEHFTALTRWSRRIAGLGEPVGEKASRLLRGLEREALRLVPVDACPGHGSYSAAQIIFSCCSTASGRTVTFDWDGYDVADPARDAARFRVALRRLGLGRLGSIRALDRPAAEFLAAYAAERGPHATANLRFFEAALCLQIAKYNIAHPVTNWRGKLEAMLDEGLRVLEGAA